MYYIYVIRCEDNTLYTGITTDLKRRFNEHFNQDKKCAKYTLRHKAKCIECAWQTENRAFASKLEYNFKKLNKNQKEEVIKDNDLLERYLKNKIEIAEYIRVNIKEYFLD